MQHQVGVDQPGLLQLIGDDAADKVGDRVPQGGHEVAERGLVDLGHGHKLAPFLAFLVSGVGALVVAPELRDEGFRGLLQQAHHRVVQGVLVLVQPAVYSVAHL